MQGFIHSFIHSLTNLYSLIHHWHITTGNCQYYSVLYIK
jgi:hypothetical protein